MNKCYPQVIAVLLLGSYLQDISATPTPSHWVAHSAPTGAMITQNGIDVSGQTICIEYDATKTSWGDYGIGSSGGGNDVDRLIWTNGPPTDHADGSWTKLGTLSAFNVTGPGSYTVTATWEDNNTPPGPPSPDAGSKDSTITKTVTLKLWKVYPVIGPSSVTRETNADYSVLVLGLTPVSYQWVSNHWVPASGDSSSWSGKIVSQTYVECDVTLQCPTGGNFVITASGVTTTVNPRSWSLTVGSVAEDNEANWGLPIDFCFAAGGVALGVHRDRLTDTPYAFYPNPDSGTWKDGYTTSNVGGSGPNKPLWYISAATITIDAETVINKWIKTNGPIPFGASWNWYNENETPGCFASFGKTCAYYKIPYLCMKTWVDLPPPIRRERGIMLS